MVASSATVLRMEDSALKLMIQSKGLRLVDVAEKVGVHKSQISKWEIGTVPPKRVLKLEEATGISRHVLRPDVYGGEVDAP